MSLLLREFLVWVGERPRTYSQAMAGWRSTCPRQTVWEDAFIDGLVRIEGGGELEGFRVTLTTRGRAVLDGREPAASSTEPAREA